jgi:hypothetical protein
VGPPNWPGGDEAWREFRAKEPVNAHSYLIAMLLCTSNVGLLESLTPNFEIARKHVMDGKSWMLLIKKGDTKPREDLQHDDMTRKQSERLSMQAYVMRMIFEKLLIEHKKELEGVRSYLLRDDFSAEPQKEDRFHIYRDVITVVVNSMCNQARIAREVAA